MSGPVDPANSGPPGPGPGMRPALLALVVVSILVAAVFLGAILIVSISLYRTPAALPVPTTTLALAAAATPTPAVTAPQRPTATRPVVGPGVGQEAPSFTLAGVDGITHTLSAYRGRTVLVNFWATWCPPCRREWPSLLSFAETADPNQVVVLSVNSEESLALVQSFVGTDTLPLPVLLDARGQVSNLYHITALPTTFVISPDGIILRVVPGEMGTDAWENLVGP